MTVEDLLGAEFMDDDNDAEEDEVGHHSFSLCNSDTRRIMLKVMGWIQTKTRKT